MPSNPTPLENTNDQLVDDLGPLSTYMDIARGLMWLRSHDEWEDSLKRKTEITHTYQSGFIEYSAMRIMQRAHDVIFHAAQKYEYTSIYGDDDDVPSAGELCDLMYELLCADENDEIDKILKSHTPNYMDDIAKQMLDLALEMAFDAGTKFGRTGVF